MRDMSQPSRASFLLSSGSLLALAACGGPTGTSILTPKDPQAAMFDAMRRAGVWAIQTSNTFWVLPEKAATISHAPTTVAPDTCAQPLVIGSHVAPMDCSTPDPTPPTIMTETVYGSSVSIYGGNFGLNGWTYGFYSGGLLGPVCTGPTYTTPRFDWAKCAGENLALAGTALTSIAQNIQNAQNAITIYGPNLLKAATWLTTGLITFSEFVTLLLAFCGPGELLALLGAVGLTIGAAIVAVKCWNS